MRGFMLLAPCTLGCTSPAPEGRPAESTDGIDIVSADAPEVAPPFEATAAIPPAPVPIAAPMTSVPVFGGTL
jgi:hypothetical protein